LSLSSYEVTPFTSFINDIIKAVLPEINGLKPSWRNPPNHGLKPHGLRRVQSVKRASCKTPLIQTQARIGNAPRKSLTQPARIALRSAHNNLGQCSSLYRSHFDLSARQAGGPAGDTYVL